MAAELDMRAVQVPGSLTDPDQMRGDVVGQPGAAVDAGQRPLVLQQQRLVARVELDPVQLLRVAPHAFMNESARSISPASCS